MYKFNNITCEDVIEAKEVIFDYVIENYDALCCDYTYVKDLITDLEDCYSYEELDRICSNYFEYEGAKYGEYKEYHLRKFFDDDDTTFKTIEELKIYLFDSCQYCIKKLMEDVKNGYADIKDVSDELAGYSYCIARISNAKTLEDVEEAISLMDGVEVVVYE